MFNIGSLVSATRRLGALTLEQLVTSLNPTAWFDATETYAKSKIAVDLAIGPYFSAPAGTFDKNANEAFSVAFCLKWNALTDNQVIFDNTDAGTLNGFFIRLNTSHSGSPQYEFYFNDGSNSFLTQADYTITTTDYIFVVVTYSGATGSESDVNWYINGSPVASDVRSSGTVTGTISNAVAARLGILNTGANPISAYYDQFQFFDKALSSTEASELYNSTFGLNHKDLDGTETFYNNIVAWYDFNVPKNFGRNYAEASHAVAGDGSAAKQLTSASSAFDKADTDYFSVGGWFRLDDVSGYDGIFAKRNSAGGQPGYVLRTAINKIQFVFEDTGNTVSTSTENITTGWHHIVWVWNTDISTMKLFFDNTQLTMSGTGSRTFQSTEPFRLISDHNGGFPLDGAVDEAFFYDGVLTDAEVSTLYNGGVVAEASTLLTTGSDATKPASLVSSWSFNEQDPALVGGDVYGTNDLTPVSIVEADLVGGKDSLDLTEVSISSSNAVLGHISGKAGDFTGVTRWTDRSGNGNDATQTTLADLPYWSENVVNTTEDAVYFNGVATHLEVGNGVLNHFDTGGWLHLVFQAKRTITTGDVLLDAYTNGWKVTLDDVSGGEAKIRFIKKASTTDGEWRTSDRLVSVDEVVTVQINYDSSDGVSGDPIIYFNGLQVAVEEVVTPVGTLNATESGNLILGESIGGTNAFQGNILNGAVTGE